MTVSQDGPSAEWYAMREAPMWVCAGGPLDGSGLTTPRHTAIYRDERCVAAGGYYALGNKQNGRYTVPTATWQLDERSDAGGE